MYLLLKIRNFKPPMLCQFFPVVWNMHIFKGMQVSKFEIPGLAEHSYVTDEDPGMGRHGGDVCRTLAGRDVIWFNSQVTGDFSAAGGDNQCLPLLTALQQLSNSETDSITSTGGVEQQRLSQCFTVSIITCRFITHQPTVQDCQCPVCMEGRQFAGYYCGITTVYILYGDKPWSRCPQNTADSVTALLAVF